MMTQDKIIRMAREAGCYEKYEICYFVREDLKRFAALVAEPWIETNNALAKEIIELKKQVDISALPIIIEAAVKEAVLVEREACAKVCDEEMDDWDYQSFVNVALNNCAAAIRARRKHG